MIEYSTVKIDVDDINKDGISFKETKIPFSNKKKTRVIVFTMKECDEENINSFIFLDKLFMVDKREENYFEAVQIEIPGIK